MWKNMLNFEHLKMYSWNVPPFQISKYTTVQWFLLDFLSVARRSTNMQGGDP